MSKETEILDALRVIIDPDLGKDIVTLGFIKELTIADEGDVSFTVELTTPACPVKERFKTQCEQVVSALPWVGTVHVTMSAQKGGNPLEAQAPGIQVRLHQVEGKHRHPLALHDHAANGLDGPDVEM